MCACSSSHQLYNSLWSGGGGGVVVVVTSICKLLHLSGEQQRLVAPMAGPEKRAAAAAAIATATLVRNKIYLGHHGAMTATHTNTHFGNGADGMRVFVCVVYPFVIQQRGHRSNRIMMRIMRARFACYICAHSCLT